MRRVVIGIFTAIVVLILLMVLCTFVKRPYETVLLLRFGRLIDEQDQSRIAYNWFMKMPTDSIVRIDRRLHLYTGPLQQVATSNKEPISVRTFAAWRIVDPVKFYKTTGGSDQKAQDIIDQKMRGLVGGKLASYSLDQFFNVDESKIQTHAVEAAVATEATNGVQTGDAKENQTGLKEQGIEIAEVGFSRMAFPPNNAEAVYLAMESRLNATARQYEAEGSVQVDTLTAEGRRDAEQIRAEATKTAMKIQGEGDAKALELIANAQKPEGAREFYQFWKKMDLLKAGISKNSMLVLSSDNPLLKDLFQAAPTPTPSAQVPPGVATTRPAITNIPEAPKAAPAGGR